VPEWLIQVVVQFPIVAVIGFVAWYAYREVKRNNADSRAQERGAHADEITRLTAAYERHLASKEAEIARLGKEFKDEIKKLVKVVTELNGRLST
jgi:type II secretory pathway component PulJ